MSVLLGAVFGSTLAFGFVLVVLGFRQVETETTTSPQEAPDRLGALSHRLDRVTLRFALAVAAGLGAFFLTGWLAGAVLVAGLAAAAPTLFGSSGRRQRSIARTEAVAGWAEMIRDTMAAAAGIEQAILATAKVAPPAIEAEVHRLALRIEREPLGDSLRIFADELDDPVADLVVASLILASEKQARDLGQLLGAAADSARETATMRLKINAGRARTYTSTRLIVAITLGFTLALVLFNDTYLEPFDTAVGQLVLLGVGAMFAGGVLMLVRLGDTDEPARLLGGEG